MSATKDVTKVDEKFKNKKHANQNKNQNPKQKNQPGQTPAKNQQPQKQQKKKFPENGGRMNVQNPLVVKRMNFLYQASNLISQIENKDSAKQKDANTLSRFYTQEMKKMSRKLVSRLFVISISLFFHPLNSKYFFFHKCSGCKENNL